MLYLQFSGSYDFTFSISVVFSQVKMVYDKETNKPRGYAFIEYAHTRDMKSLCYTPMFDLSHYCFTSSFTDATCLFAWTAAYKQADGRKIDGRRVLVDVERGRTVPNWRPRRLGGGLGTTRVGDVDVNQRSVR